MTTQSGLGYRTWDGPRTSRARRAVAIARLGVVLAWRSVWLRRIVYCAWIPVLYYGAAFLAFESLDLVGGVATGGSQAVREFFENVTSDLRDDQPFPSDTGDARELVWRFLLFQFFSATQAFFLFLIIGQVAPPLISRDLATRAYLLYFSRPIDRMQYIAGKLGTLATYIFAVTALPSLGLYVVALFAASDRGALLSTWDLPIRIIVSTVVLAVPMSALALAMSAATQRPRFAQAAWFVMWIGGWMLYGAARAGEVADGTGGDTDGSLVHLFSLFHTLRRAQSSVFDFAEGSSFAAFTLLTIITVASLAFVAKRVAAPVRE
jgi:ABC-2 type transport system permease protein